MNRVPFLDLDRPHSAMRQELDDAYRRVLDASHYIMGKELAAFEQEFAGYTGAAFASGVGNGLEALRLILVGLGIGPGDEVIVPAHTFIASWLAVSEVGATPVPVDVDPRNFNLDPALIGAAITPHTRAIMPVHLYGLMAPMDEICSLAERHGFAVIEDAAQAHGARWQDRPAGSWGAAAGFSFYPGKNLGALGDGGAVTTSDARLHERVRSLRNYGSPLKYHHEVQGYNSRLDELQAAFLRAKLAHLEGWNERRRVIAARYTEAFRGLKRLRAPEVPAAALPVWHLYAVMVEGDRAAVQARLAEQGIETLIHYPIPPHLAKAYAGLGYGPGDFPVAEAIAEHVLSLPMGPHLTGDEVQRVIDAVAALG